MALGWCILIRKPGLRGVVYSSTGGKFVEILLEHEYIHIHRQRAKGVFTWMYRYLTNKKFREDEEYQARLYETGYQLREIEYYK